MDASLSLLRLAVTMFVVVGLLFTFWMNRLARIGATTAADAAADTVAARLAADGQGCADRPGSDHKTLENIAARDVVDRTGPLAAITPTALSVIIDPARCTVLVAVTATALASRLPLASTVVACRPIRSYEIAAGATPPGC